MRFLGLIKLVCVFILLLNQGVTISQTQIGQTVYGEPYQWFGNEVELSSNEEYFVSGSPYSPSEDVAKGEVNVFGLVNNEWKRIGQSLTGVDTFSLFGESVSISGDGSCIAVGAPGFDVLNVKGRVGIYCIENNKWMLKGNEIIGQEDFQFLFGIKVSMSENGNRVLIASEGRTFWGWLFQVYEWTGSDWVQGRR